MTPETPPDNGSAVPASSDAACHAAEPPRQEDITEASREEKQREYQREYRKRNLERLRAQKAAYNSRPEVKANRRKRDQSKTPEEKAAIADYNRAWREKNCDHVKAKRQDYYLRNKEKIDAENMRRYYADPEQAKERMRRYREENSDKVKERYKKWLLDNAEQVRANNRRNYLLNKEDYARRTRESEQRRMHDPEFRLIKAMRARLRAAVRAKGARKHDKTFNLIGCTIPELQEHLSAQFAPGMTWENYGSMWHVDHIRPIASFRLLNPAQQKECFHFSNLQPLWAEDNFRKSDKYEPVANLAIDP